ncbi:MAG: GGDEF domain-containing protein [Pseudomonadota bacterium]
MAVVARAQLAVRRRRLSVLLVTGLVAVNATALAGCLAYGGDAMLVCLLLGGLGLAFSLTLARLMFLDWQLADRVLGATDAARRRLDRLAHADALTGLPNRRALQRELLRWCAEEEQGLRGFALHLVDVDDLKRINDRFGHAAGDAVLQAVALRLGATVRQSDLVVRLAGDEFVVLQREATPLAAERLAGRMVEALRHPLDDDRAPLIPTVSIGTAVYGGNRDAPEALLRAADEALYLAKAHGRNGFVLAGPTSAPPQGLEAPLPASVG